MNPTVAIISIFFVAYTQAHTKELHATEVYKLKVRDECNKDIKATPEQSEIVSKFKEVPKDETEKCLLECIYIKTGGIDADGKYSVEGFNKLIDMKYKGDENTNAKKINTDCAKKAVSKEGEKCSLGGSIRECFAAAAKENDFFTI
uniref:Odorant-binding protein 20 n=1 Tax=Adelphocoris lineolatus TaxID=236346 RepID=A0A346RVG5_ADELI|nr:odorant-binding protein 20 [Adelphocoris lineolatus]